MIRLEQVSWTYPHAESPAVRRLDLHVRPGECVVLCGASGSGKSTALKLMNGLIPHFHEDGLLEGTVWVDSITTREADLDAIGLVTGTVLQHPRRQFFTDTAREEVAFAMENFGFPPDRLRSRTGAALADLAGRVPLTGRLRHLSGGQQQQVAITAATAHGPRAVLLDEPSSNLSSDAVHRLAAALACLKSQGVAVVVAEHRLRYLEEVADRVVVMRDGLLDAEWSAAEFRAVSDEDLAREGLRGRTRDAVLPALAASGASVAAPAPPSDAGALEGAGPGAPRAAGAAAPTAATAATAVAGEAAGGLELEGVRCRLGGRPVLELDRVEFPRGQVTAIRGPNGAGKTTLARIVAGLQGAAGTVRLDGRPLKAAARRRAAAIVMQDVQRQLFTDSVAAELKLAAGRPREARHEALLAALDLDHLAERHPLALSGGQQQRLVVAAVRLAARPVVVFDEPSSGVDRRHLGSVSDQVRGLAADGAVVLLISHDEDLLAQAADAQLTLAPPRP